MDVGGCVWVGVGVGVGVCVCVWVGGCTYLCRWRDGSMDQNTD